MGVFPFLLCHLYLSLLASATHAHLVVVEAGDDAYLAVVVESVGVVFDKHHLCSHLEHEVLCRGVRRWREGAFYLGVIHEGSRGEAAHLVVVVFVGHAVVGGEADISLFGLWRERRVVARLESDEVLLCGAVLANVVEEVNKLHVGLPVDFLELNGDVIHLL